MHVDHTIVVTGNWHTSNMIQVPSLLGIPHIHTTTNTTVEYGAINLQKHFDTVMAATQTSQ